MEWAEKAPAGVALAFRGMKRRVRGAVGRAKPLGAEAHLPPRVTIQEPGACVAAGPAATACPVPLGRLLVPSPWRTRVTGLSVSGAEQGLPREP